MGSYRDLKVWQEAKALAVAIYEETRAEAWSRDWGLRDQIRRAAVSVLSNIAEGVARKSQQDSIRFFQIASGSLAELTTQLEIASEIGYVSEAIFDDIFQRADRLQASVGALVRTRRQQPKR